MSDSATYRTTGALPPNVQITFRDEATQPEVRQAAEDAVTASAVGLLRRDWCVEDPVLRTLPNLKMAAGTNYPLARDQVERLAALWSRTGRDWTRDESVAGLWAYAGTNGGPVSVATVERGSPRTVSGRDPLKPHESVYAARAGERAKGRASAAPIARRLRGLRHHNPRFSVRDVNKRSAERFLGAG